MPHSRTRPSCASSHAERQHSSIQYQDDEFVSFDLYAFPAPGPATVAEARKLLKNEDLSWDSEAGTWLPSPGPEMAAFMDELERRWPSLNDDPDDSPWASWPLWQPAEGGGTALSISWSFVDSTVPAILEMAARADMIIYDPQTGELTRPRAL
jgi:hypothetical protein